MQLVDTHCHIHEATLVPKGDEFMQSKWHKAGITDPAPIIAEAREAGVTKLICVGTTLSDSRLAVELAQKQTGCYASIGIHPHESEDHNSNEHLDEFRKLATEQKVVAVGECGLDYYYEHSPKKHQQELLEFQLDLALKHNLPLIFHVRDAFDDFFAILGHFQGVRGVIHSFTADKTVLDKALNTGLYLGLNGIMTFTKAQDQLEAAKAVPLQKLLFETDAPFLTPHPFRGTICKPKYLRVTAEFLSNLRGENLEELALATTQNAANLFNLSEE
jgi:TatD DNase family protein